MNMETKPIAQMLRGTALRPVLTDAVMPWVIAWIETSGRVADRLNGSESLTGQVEVHEDWIGTRATRRRPSFHSTGAVRFALPALGPWNEVVDAIIRDLHEDGARLRLNSRVVVTGRLRLEIPPSAAVHMADVAWQRGDEIGVRLIATLDETVERQIEALRRAGAQMRRSRRRPTDDDSYWPRISASRSGFSADFRTGPMK